MKEQRVCADCNNKIEKPHKWHPDLCWRCYWGRQRVKDTERAMRNYIVDVRAGDARDGYEF